MKRLILWFCGAACAAAPAAAEEAPTLLEEITVTANRVDGPRAAIGSAVSSISGEELERRQIRIVSDALRELPGVSVSRSGPLGALTDIRIRGSEANHTLVLIDGIEVNDSASGGQYDFANLLALEVERIDVLRGPQSALYGSQAVGGVINIVTRRGEPGPARFRANLEGGSFGTATGNASVSGGAETYDYLFAAQGFHTRGVSSARAFDAYNPRSSLDRDGYESGTGLAKVSVRPGENIEVTGVARYTEFDADRDGYGTPANGSPYSAAVDSKDTEKGKQFFGRTQVKATAFDGAWENIAGVSYTNQDRRNFDGSGARTSQTIGETTKVDYQSNLRFETGDALPASHVLTFGADNQHDHIVSKSIYQDPAFGGNGPVRKSIDDTGVVGQYQLGLSERLFLTGSVRRDLNERFRDATTYRFASAYTFEGTGTKVRASYGTGVKNPTLTELYGFYGTFAGNPGLKPERGRGWDAGFDQPVLNDKLTFSATYFEQRVSDLISSAFDASIGKSKPINLPGVSKIHGVELEMTVRPWEPVTIRAAYTYSRGDDATGAELVRRPRNIASVNFGYAFLENRANANVEVVYNGKQKDLRFLSGAPYTSAQVELKAYTLVNLAASYKVTENAEVYGRVENLFDKRYQEVFSYNTPGRAAYGGIKISF